MTSDNSDNNERTPDLVANIYDLSEAELTKIQEQEGDSYVFWRQLLPGCQEFGEKILTEATTSSKVISISSGFGSGKTHFITRFCEYAKKKGHKSHYLSVCEDYYDHPVILLSKMLYKAFPDSSKKTKDFIKNVAKSTDINIGVTKNCGISVNLDGIVKSFEKHPMKELKDYLKARCKNDKAILIFDELDRCEPEFALRFLKLIKHFSGIEGLSIILVFNKTVLCKILNNRYGIDFNEGNNAEDYFLKFIDREFLMPIPDEDDYCNVVNRFVKGLPNFKKSKIQKEIESRVKSISSVFLQNSSSVRQIDKILSNIEDYLLCESFDTYKKLDNEIALKIPAGVLSNFNHTLPLLVAIHIYNMKINSNRAIPRTDAIPDEWNNTLKEVFGPKTDKKIYEIIYKYGMLLLRDSYTFINAESHIRNYSEHILGIGKASSSAFYCIIYGRLFKRTERGIPKTSRREYPHTQ